MDDLHNGVDTPTVRLHAWAALNAGPPPSDVGDPWAELIPPPKKPVRNKMRPRPAKTK